ncbi:hypothetical protein A6R68_00620 [Neotoma lepida]|uniref:Uncharacterized protein n=1 Tax=Neotoma lepida TaxID=56216 RepID=A0A1A6GWY1_NEOLE|nr:hypothetical protein A6R68_00620 [Neotoma lepida]
MTCTSGSASQWNPQRGGPSSKSGCSLLCTAESTETMLRRDGETAGQEELKKAYGGDVRGRGRRAHAKRV